MRESAPFTTWSAKERRLIMPMFGSHQFCNDRRLMNVLTARLQIVNLLYPQDVWRELFEESKETSFETPF